MIKSKKIQFLVGSKNFSNKSLEPFDNTICNFLSDLSKQLSKNAPLKKYPDVAAFSFWLRKNNIDRFKNYFKSTEIRLGIGLLFHITPSNIPTNFAYSLVFGLITGNSNIIKVPSKKFEQVSIICESVNILLRKYKKIQGMINIIRYEDHKSITKSLSKLSDGRIIWGGDKTIQEVRKHSSNPRCLDITFPDRYSFCVINSKIFKKLKNSELKRLVENFYNDTYLVDQNACSSPHLVVWLGKGDKKNRLKFWEYLNEVVKKKYDISHFASMDKITKLYRDIIELKNLNNFVNFESNLHVINLKSLNQNNHEMRGKWGFFYEFETDKLEKINKFINKKYQTLTYFGLKKIFISKFVKKNKLQGIDRIVPIGQSLNMNFFWDGYDINKILTRVIDIQ